MPLTCEIKGMCYHPPANFRVHGGPAYNSRGLICGHFGGKHCSKWVYHHSSSCIYSCLKCKSQGMGFWFLREFLCSSGWSWTQITPVSTSQVLWLNVCATTACLNNLFVFSYSPGCPWTQYLFASASQHAGLKGMYSANPRALWISNEDSSWALCISSCPSPP